MPNQLLTQVLEQLQLTHKDSNNLDFLLKKNTGMEVVSVSDVDYHSDSFELVVEKPAGVQRKIRVKVEDLGLVKPE